MFQLFQSIFGINQDDTPYPEELINRAIERTVDVVDPRLRALPGYKKKLRTSIIYALDHVVNLVDNLPAPIQLNKANFLCKPELSAYFSSYSNAINIVSIDPVLNQWPASSKGASKSSSHKNDSNIVMLLLMEIQENQGYGMALDGDMLRRDVPQTTINFTHHRLLDPSRVEEETRKRLKRRAFDHLLELALHRLATTHTQRAELEKEQSLLRQKHSLLKSDQWGFDETNSDAISDQQTVLQQLENIESQLLSLGAGSGLLNTHLGIIVDVLMQAEKNLWKEQYSLIINRMHIKQKQLSDDADEINLTILHNITGKKLIAQLVTIADKDLPPRHDFLHEAERFLR